MLIISLSRTFFPHQIFLNVLFKDHQIFHSAVLWEKTIIFLHSQGIAYPGHYKNKGQHDSSGNIQVSLHWKIRLKGSISPIVSLFFRDIQSLNSQKRYILQ